MTSEQFAEIMNRIDDDMIVRAKEKVTAKPRGLWVKLASAAACLALVTLLAAGVMQSGLIGGYHVAELGNGSTADSALAIGVYCACIHYDYLSAVQLAANQDGISDICAFIAGALKGVLHGYSEIPSSFIKKLQFADIIKDYAARLTKAAPKSLNR